MIDVSIVVPVFDNRSTLDELIDRLIAVLEPQGLSFELIFVDDGSRDGSLELLRGRAASDPRIRVHAMTRNFGSQSALVAGFDQVRGKRTVCLDADLEYYPEDVPALLEQLDAGYDLVCGVRAERKDGRYTRQLPSAILNAWVRRQTGTRVRDIGSAMRAMDSAILKDLASEGEHRRLMTPVLLRRARSVAEVPIRHKPKGVPGGHSFFTLLGIATDYYLLTAKRPFLVSGVFSLLAAGIGVLGLGLALLGVGWAPVGFALLAAGGIGALVSLIGEYAQRSYQLRQGIPFYQLREDEPVSPLGKGPEKPPDAGTRPGQR